MSFLAPGFLIAAGVAALVIVGLHFLSTRDPKLELLPTVRFLPDLPVRATSTTVQPTDPWLLLLRLLLVLLAGLALARPVLTPTREPVARIVAVDVSRAVGDAVELADSAERYLDGAASVVLFDSVAYEVGKGADGVPVAVDRLRALGAAAGERGTEPRRPPASTSSESMRREVPPQNEDLASDGAPPWPGGTRSRGSLSASFIAARQAAARIRNRADSLELVVISPFMAEEYDAATRRIRQLWPGRVTTVRVAAAVAHERQDSTRIEWADSMASAAAVSSAGAADPAGEAAFSSSDWTAREPPDTMAAVRAGDVVLVYPFVRRWDLSTAVKDSEARVIARWADGEPAGIERPLDVSSGADASGAGATSCVRSFGFSLPAEGDAALRPEFQRFFASLRAPCGATSDSTPLPASVMASLAGNGPLAATASIERRVERATSITPWLLIACLLLGVLELVVRRRGGRAALVGASGSASPDSKARAA